MLVAGFAGLVALGDLRANPRATIALLLIAGLGYALAASGLARTWIVLDRRGRRRAMAGIFALALGLRLAALLVPPTLSDDIYRYRWDGRVQAAGLNPYDEPPGAASLTELRDEHWAQINYPRIRSIYPPLAQLLFAVTYRVSTGLWAYQLLAVLGDLLTIGLLLACLRAWSLPGWTFALYALHPLPVVEYASSGHYDGWVTAAVLGALLAHRLGRPLASTCLLAAGILLKTWPVILVPVLLRRRPRWHLALLGFLVAGAFLPFVGAGNRMLQPWLDFTGRWRFNDGLFFVLHALTGSLAGAKALAAGLGAGLLTWLWARNVEPVRAAYWLLLGFIALLPTVHPWYMLWALPLAAMARDRGWLLLCLLAPVAYWILAVNDGSSTAWVEPWWPRYVEYLPAATVWLHAAWRGTPPAPPAAAEPTA